MSARDRVGSGRKSFRNASNARRRRIISSWLLDGFARTSSKIRGANGLAFREFASQHEIRGDSREELVLRQLESLDDLEKRWNEIEREGKRKPYLLQTNPTSFNMDGIGVSSLEVN